MLKNVFADVTPSVLVWARTTIGFDIDDAARRLKITAKLLEQWENGEGKPTIPQLRLLQRHYKRPTATFYLPEPPKDTKPPKDFRLLPGNQAGLYSRILRLAFRYSEMRQDFARETRLAAKREHIKLIGSASLVDDPAELAGKARADLLAVSAHDQFNWKTPSQAYSTWRSKLEGLGILVFQTSGVPLGEMRGFSLRDPIAPIINVNSKDYFQPRCFTLMHEFCHLLLDVEGVCDLFDRTNGTSKDVLKMEVFCNAFAGALLVPDIALREETEEYEAEGRREWDDEELADLARTFKVSKEAILRRLLTLGKTTEDFYNRKRRELNEEYERDRAKKEAKNNKKRKFPPPHVRSLRKNGRTFSRMTVDAFQEGAITGGELAEHLDIKLERLSAIRHELI